MITAAELQQAIYPGIRLSGMKRRVIRMEEESIRIERQKYKAKLRARKARLADPEKFRESNRRYRLKNIERVKALKRAWYEMNKDRHRVMVRESMRRWRARNPGHKASDVIYKREYYAKNRDKINAYRRARYALVREWAK